MRVVALVREVVAAHVARLQEERAVNAVLGRGFRIEGTWHMAPLEEERAVYPVLGRGLRVEGFQKRDVFLYRAVGENAGGIFVMPLHAHTHVRSHRYVAGDVLILSAHVRAHALVHACTHESSTVMRPAASPSKYHGSEGRCVCMRASELERALSHFGGTPS